MLAIADSQKVITNFKSNNHSLNTIFTKNMGQSKLFGDMSLRTKYFLQQQKPLYFNHLLGFSFENFENNENLKSFFNILSFNFDKDNKRFISTIEAKKYPIWGV